LTPWACSIRASWFRKADPRLRKSGGGLKATADF